MDLKSFDYHCPRCHATIGFERNSCPACQSVLPATVPPWPTSQAHEGGVGSPSNASALGNAADSKSPAYNPTNPTPDALNQNHQVDLTAQPPPTTSGSNRVRAVRERLYKFIHHSGPPAVDTVRAARACLSCYNSVKCTPGPNSDCCGPCKGKNRYCRGPFHAPVLIDIQSWFKTAFASLESQSSSLETVAKERSMYSVSIEANKTGAIENYDFYLQSVDDHATTSYDPSSLAKVLDVVFPADQKASLNTRILASQHNPDDNVESVVRRFVACSMLLCAPASSRIDGSKSEHAATPYIVLEFIRRIGQEACNLFQCICHEADQFANSKPRNKVTFVADKRLFAFNLGLVHSSVQSLVSAKSNATGSHFVHENIYDVVPAVLEKLEWLAMGFNKTAFVDGKRCLRSELTELHIGFCSLKGKTSISDSRYGALRAQFFGRYTLMLQQSSNQASSPRDNLVPNVPRINSPIAQDSAAQSPGQVSESSLIQRSGEKMVENCPESPWLARELDRFYQNDLDDILRSPAQERSLQEDVIRQAKTELKNHDSAIHKHLAKKAALEEKSKTWELDGVSSHVLDSDEGAVDPFKSETAIEKRIRELEEASKRQDLAIQKHNVKKAALERGIKRHLAYEPERPSKKPVLKLVQDSQEDSEEDTEGYSEEERYECSESLPSVAGSDTDSEPFLGFWREPKQQTPFKETIRYTLPDLEHASGGPATSGRSFTHWLLSRGPSSFGSVMDGMFKKFERVAIGVWPTRKSRPKSAVPVEDSVTK